MAYQGNGSYLDTEALNALAQKGDYENYVKLMQQTMIANLTNFNSPMYQQYASYLQKNTPGIGVNSLLAPLMAGGTGYAGGQNIANQQLAGLNKERQDKINTGVQGFALGNINLTGNLLGQRANLQLGYDELKFKKEQEDNANSPWKAIGGLLGNALPMVANLFGAPLGSTGASGASPVGGYGG